MLSKTLSIATATKRVAPPFSRRLVISALETLRNAHTTLEDAWGRLEFGSATEELATQLTVNNPLFYKQLLSQGELGAADTYGDGHWDCTDLPTLFRIILKNKAAAQPITRSSSLVGKILKPLQMWLRRNNRGGSRRNIHAHYDLGNAFFKLFLDKTLNYSSAVFESPTDSLQKASCHKMDLICRDLELCETDHLVEIGSGWGALAMHAATNYGCRVTTTTISQQQFTFVTQAVEEAGLGQKITVLDQDYRDLRGQFDKLVSVEMIEAVGHKYLPTFFTKCNSLLKPGGRMALQAILMNDANYPTYLRSTDFIREFIFPGGCLPCQSGIDEIRSSSTELETLSSRDITSHYAETLKRWRTSVHESSSAIHALGFDERFLRLWNYYLAYCEAAFEERHCTTIQATYRRATSP